MYEIDKSLLEKIDALELSEKNKAWRAAMKAAPWRVYVDRERLTVQSWRETEGEDLELRIAKMLKKVMDNVPIRIHPFDEIVGRPTPGVIGCQTAINVCGDYIHDIWNDDGVIGVTLDASAILNREELEVLREAVRVFEPNCMPKRTYDAWHELVGDWAKQAEAAKLRDPSLQNGITGQSTSTLDWPNILPAGLKEYIRRCEEHIDRYIASGGTDVNKVYFWRASVIVLQAVIDHSRRYAALAREMAAEEADDAEKARLLNIAETCEYVPENPPRTLHEALQFMEMCSLAKVYENPMQNNSHWGRADQYLYGYFMSLSTGILWQSGDQYGNDILFSLVRILCIFGLASRYKGTGKLSRFITYIGSNTMGIYLIHYPLRNLTVRYFRMYVPIPEYCLKTLVYSALLFFVSWVIMIIVKRIPVVKKLIG